jgi:hypothetical protein
MDRWAAQEVGLMGIESILGRKDYRCEKDGWTAWRSQLPSRELAGKCRSARIVLLHSHRGPVLHVPYAEV